MARFLLEMGAEPRTCWPPTAPSHWAKKVQALFDSSPYGASAEGLARRDLWHMRSLLHTEPVDFLIGNSYGKYLERDCRHAADPR
jgi:nitrogenase molybdenum-iron protein beta chain